MHRTIHHTILAATAWLMALAGAQAQSVIVVSHPSISLTAAEVRDVFLGEKQLAGATKLVPVDNSSLQEQFLGKLVHLDLAKYGSVWTKKSFREGLTAPAVKGSDAEVLDFVRRTPGAVGYVKASAAGVTVVTQQ